MRPRLSCCFPTSTPPYLRTAFCSTLRLLLSTLKIILSASCHNSSGYKLYDSPSPSGNNAAQAYLCRHDPKPPGFNLGYVQLHARSDRKAIYQFSSPRLTLETSSVLSARLSSALSSRRPAITRRRKTSSAHSTTCALPQEIPLGLALLNNIPANLAKYSRKKPIQVLPVRNWASASLETVEGRPQQTGCSAARLCYLIQSLRSADKPLQVLGRRVYGGFF